MPSSWVISSPISWWERLRSFQVPAPASYSRAARSGPCRRSCRRLSSWGAPKGGCRVTSSRRPATVSSRRTSVRVPTAAWSLRRLMPGRSGGRRAPSRTARSRRRRGRRSCPRRWVRAAGRVRPPTGRRSRPPVMRRRAEGGDVQPVQPHRATSRRVSSRAHRVEGVTQHGLFVGVGSGAAHVRDEVLRDLLVAASGEAPGVGHGRVVRGPLGVEEEAQRVQEAVGEPGHGVGRTDRVGEGRLDPRLLVRGEPGVGEQLLQGAAQPGEVAWHRAVDALGGDRAFGVRSTSHMLSAVPVLGEGSTAAGSRSSGRAR